MDEWMIEEDLSLLGGGEPRAQRILDQQMLQEPIRRLEPRAPLAVAPSAPLAEAIRLMREHRVGCLLVVEGERLVGIVTERDFLLKLDRPDSERPVGELMTPDPEVLTPDDPIVYALNKMSVGGFRHVPLVDAARRPVGVVSVKDIIDYLADFFASDVLTVPPDPARAQAWRGRDGG
jgi:CBS domain-containing protein